MKLDWLPNWRNKSEYPDPKQMNNSRWAWEFLRRNKEYQQDYERFQVYLQYHEDKAPHTPLDVYAVCDPPALENETEDKYTKRMAEADQYWKITPLPVALAEKHGLYHRAPHALIDPRKDDPARLLFSTESSPSLLGSPGGVFMWLREYAAKRAPVSEVVVKFDLELPIDVQIEKAKILLEWKQGDLDKDGLIQPKKPRNRKEKYVNYLRLLDAEVCGVEVREMAEVIFPHIENSHSIGYLGDKTARNQLQAAKKMRDSYYRYLTMNRRKKPL